MTTTLGSPLLWTTSSELLNVRVKRARSDEQNQSGGWVATRRHPPALRLLHVSSLWCPAALVSGWRPSTRH